MPTHAPVAFFVRLYRRRRSVQGGWGQMTTRKHTESLTTDPRAFSGIAIVFGSGSLQAVGANAHTEAADKMSTAESLASTPCSAAVPPPVALLDAYQSSFQICYASNIMRNCRICNKYFEGKEMNGVETLYYA